MGAGRPHAEQTQAVSYVIQASQEEQEERDEDNPIIIAEAKTPVHEMAVADAVMQMDLSDQPFVVFRNASHGEINVVYRREDGNIGWIDPATPPRSSSEAVAHAKSSRASRETAARSKLRKRAVGARRQRLPSFPDWMGKTMHLGDFIAPEAVIPSLKAKNKKQLLQELAARAAVLTGLEERYIFDVLLQRERLGSTGLGQGIAIPHGKFAGLKGIVGIFARLAEPIDFDAVDGEPVDIVFLLLAPEGAGADHLKALARISRLLRDGVAVEKLRASKDAAALYAVLTEEAASHAA